MKRFSQRSHMVTLSEINITPLLDLAFVLLIIFIITTPLLSKGLELNLPKATAQPDRQIRREDIRTVEITEQGAYAMNLQYMSLDQVIAQLVRDYRSNPKLVIYVRADANSRVKNLVALIDACVQNGISRYSLRTEPIGKR
jgi:biopolymer transport protein ExbD